MICDARPALRFAEKRTDVAKGKLPEGVHPKYLFVRFFQCVERPVYLQCRFFIAQTLFDRSIRQNVRRREIRLPLSTLRRSEKCIFRDLAQPDIPFTFAAKAVYAFQRLEKSFPVISSAHTASLQRDRNTTS